MFYKSSWLNSIHPKKEAIKVEEGLLRRSGSRGERGRQSESNENLKIQHIKVWNCHIIVKTLEKYSLTFFFCFKLQVFVSSSEGRVWKVDSCLQKEDNLYQVVKFVYILHWLNKSFALFTDKDNPRNIRTMYLQGWETLSAPISAHCSLWNTCQSGVSTAFECSWGQGTHLSHDKMSVCLEISRYIECSAEVSLLKPQSWHVMLILPLNSS